MELLSIGLGSNSGDRLHLLTSALNLIAEYIGKPTAISSVYETVPWGFESPHMFLNAAVTFLTDLPPCSILRHAQAVEQKLGRKHLADGKRYSDRPIDIDILLYGKLVMNTCFCNKDGNKLYLSLPHPLMHVRNFVLKPLAEIAPQSIHPLTNRTIKDMANSLSNQNDEIIRKFSDLSVSTLFP